MDFWVDRVDSWLDRCWWLSRCSEVVLQARGGVVSEAEWFKRDVWVWKWIWRVLWFLYRNGCRVFVVNGGFYKGIGDGLGVGSGR